MTTHNLLFAGLLCLVVAPAAAQDPQIEATFAGGASRATMPFEIASAKVHVKADFEGAEPVWLLLDSGANMSILDRSFAARLGLELRGEGTTDGAAGGGSFWFAFARAPAFSLPGVEIASRAVAVIDRKTQGANGHASSGLLGADLFRAFVVDVDYPNRTLTLHDPESFSYEGEGVELPVTFDANGKWLVPGVVGIGERRVPARLLVDTGSRGTIDFTTHFAAEHDLREALPAKMKTTVGVGVGGEVRHWVGRVSGLRLGAAEGDADGGRLELGPLPVTFAPEGAAGTASSPGRDGVLGGKILERFRVVFDHSRSRILLEPSATTAEPFAWDASGLFLAAEGADFRLFEVLAVADGTPAEESGLQVGDLIVSIDGKTGSEISLDDARALFRTPGATYRLAVKRGAERLEFELVTRPLV